MLNYSFFNAILDPEGNPDRAFDANDFSKYFGTLIKNGIFPNPSTNFQIQGDQNNMSVKAEPGLAWIEGHLAYDDSVFILNIDPADSTIDRIDRVVLRLDTLERCIKWVVKKGELSGRPVAKTLQRDADAYEIALADITINHGATKVTQTMITDLRMNTELCGWVTGSVTQIDTTTLFNQMEQWKADYIAKTNTWTDEQKALFLAWVKQFETDSANWKKEQETLFSNWSTEEKRKFDEWFLTIKNILDTNVAGNLQSQINSLKTKDTELENKDAELEKNLTEAENNIKKLQDERPLQLEKVILRSKWQENRYSFESEYPFNKYNIYLLDFGANATEEQIIAWGDAMIKGSISENVLTAISQLGAPKIDISIIIEVVKK